MSCAEVGNGLWDAILRIKMIKLKLSLTAFFTGWFFAVLQFGFLMLLQINISSAYLTYMVITLSWMTGTVSGLWIPRLSMPLGVGLGTISYYIVYTLVSYNPFSPLTLPVASIGVAISGLWAGHFFVTMLDKSMPTDSIFFHENNGFIVGLVTFFAGFTQIGRPFLLYVPLALALGLLISSRLKKTS